MFWETVKANNLDIGHFTNYKINFNLVIDRFLIPVYFGMELDKQRVF